MKTEPQMRQNPIRYLGSLIVLLFILVSSGTALAAGNEHVEIANVHNGSTISELGVLKGTVDFPDFLKYEIFLASGNKLIWSGNSHSPVINGNLVRIDPRVFNSDEYQIVVRMVRKDSNYTDFLGPRVKIHNPLGSPVPYYPQIEPSFLYPSDQFAIIRVRNCSGEDFHFDYNSPDGGKNADDRFLNGKSGDSICIFEDLAWIPGKYRGSGQGGGQSNGHGFEIQAEAGHVYEILYLGGSQITVNEVGADNPQAEPRMGPGPMQQPGSGPMQQPDSGPMQQPGSGPMRPADNKPGGEMDMGGAMSGPDQKPQGMGPNRPPENKPQPMLPVTGEDIGLNLPVAIMGFVLIVILGVGGVLAVRRRPALTQPTGRSDSRSPTKRSE
jgi:hypothetical protein